MENSAPTHRRPSAERGVVWLASGASAPAGLLNALALRGIRVTVVVDAASALREVIRGDVACVVLHEPSRLARAGELVATLDRYFPSVQSHRFGEAAPAPANGDRAPLPTTPTPDRSRTLPIFGEPRDTADDSGIDRLSTRVSVTDAELSMLLGGMGDDLDASDPLDQAEGGGR